MRLRTFFLIGINLGAILVGIFIFENLPIVQQELRKVCLLKPRNQYEELSCLGELGIKLSPYHPEYAKSIFKNGIEEFIPLSGIPNVSTLLCNEGGPWQSFQSDPYGYSNSPYVWKEKALDILLLGDSFTIGECVSPHERFATLIQSQIPRTLNLGYPNSGPLSELARYLEYGQQRKPKHVFLFYYELNDPSELLDEYSNPLLARYLDKSGFTQNLESKSSVIEANLPLWLNQQLLFNPLKEKGGFASSKKIIQWVNEKLFYRTAKAATNLYPRRPNPDPVVPLLDKIFGRYRELITSGNSQLTIVYLPSKSGDFHFYKKEVIELVAKYQFGLIDMEIIFSQQKMDPYSGHEPYHYNKVAHRFIAEKVLNKYGNLKH